MRSPHRVHSAAPAAPVGAERLEGSLIQFMHSSAPCSTLRSETVSGFDHAKLTALDRAQAIIEFDLKGQALTAKQTVRKVAEAIEELTSVVSGQPELAVAR